jgi:hypothetical protein
MTSISQRRTSTARQGISCFIPPLALAILLAMGGPGLAEKYSPTRPTCTKANTVTAKVVALEQIYFYNRFGSFNPSGLMYALRRDVVGEDDGEAIASEPKSSADAKLAGHVRLRDGKRPRPLVLRVNEGDCLKVTFTNLLAPTTTLADKVTDPSTGKDILIDAEEPATRHASMHVNGLNLADSINSDGSNVGKNPSSLAAPGETVTYTWYGKAEGGYLMYSMAGPAGGEGDGGQLGLGLFGAVNVQPNGALWYRSQVTADELEAATKGKTAFDQPIINYATKFQDGPHKGEPVLAMLNEDREIIYSDLNAVIDVHPSGLHLPSGEDCQHVTGPGSVCGKPYREFTTIFHDEITAVQAYPELDDETNPLHALRDGMAINYGAAGLGSMVLANQKRIGPAANCAECKLEEFFLTSWANGDPAMVVERDPTTNTAIRALYPDDPSNVHHSYMGDPVRFRNMHAGPKETHVFHLHAHQWVQDKHDPNSVYLDSQTLSPGASFSYEIHYGGSGNRNFTVGDSIFHCHLYPHFAQGMWELWRSHDVFEAGTHDRNLPDGEFAGGTPNPAIVPLPRTPMPRMPTPEVKGYPFFIAGTPGHRPPQPPKDLDRDEVSGEVSDGGLPRHRFEDAIRVPAVDELPRKNPDDPECKAVATTTDLYDRGKTNSACVAGRVRNLNADSRFVSLAQKLATARLTIFPFAKLADGSFSDGSADERRAMDFHAGVKGVDGAPAIPITTSYGWKAKGYPSCDSVGHCDSPGRPVRFLVNGGGPKPGAPYADPCLKDSAHENDQLTRVYRAAYVQFDMTVNKAGWHDPQARIAVLEQDIKNTFTGDRPPEPLFFRVKSDECVVFKATNLVPSTLNVDDFQIASPTDVLGQHIHLVKFDVTSSDGSGNGWNYEDGTLAADEVRERISAYNRYQQSISSTPSYLMPKVHSIFAGGPMAGDPRGQCPAGTDPTAWASPEMALKHPFCGAQTTVQRWWADPLLNDRGKDRTLRTVFTHDHFGPSSHQHHGLYAALVVEPRTSTWETIDGKTPLGTREGPGQDGGPTSFSANIITRKPGVNCANDADVNCFDTDHTAREFNMAFADYALLYTTDSPKIPVDRNQPINAPNRTDAALPSPTLNTGTPIPEGISTKDPGSQLINYRNEPIPLRIGEQKTYAAAVVPPNPYSCDTLPDGSHSCTEQRAAADAASNMANVFSSKVHAWQANAGENIFTEKLGKGRDPGDPATPLLMAYARDKVQVRLIQGAQEENHIFNMHGVKWLSQPESHNSGYVNAQPIGISEHFEFNVDIDPVSPQLNTDYLYSSTATDNLWDGQWGILRAFGWDKDHDFLKRLPTNPVVGNPKPILPTAGSACPAGVDMRQIDVTAGLARDLLETQKSKKDGTLSYNDKFGLTDPNAILFMRMKEMIHRGPASALDQVVCDQSSSRPEVPKCSNKLHPEPLILRASAGECISVNLTNALPDKMPDTVRTANDPKFGEYAASWSYNSMPPITKGFNFNQFTSSNHISLHPQLVAVNGMSEDGSNVGNNNDSTVPPGETKTYHWYAGNRFIEVKPFANGTKGWNPVASPMEFGSIALRDMADVVKHSSHGAIGALVIEPANARWDVDKEPHTGNPKNASATVRYKDHSVSKAGVERIFRDFVLLYQDDVSLNQKGTALPNLRNADDSEDTGLKGFNYREEPMWARYGAQPSAEPEMMSNNDYANAFSSRVSQGPCIADPANGKFCDPETPIFEASAGTPVRFRIMHVAGHPRNHAFTLFGHDWILNPWVCGTESSVMGWNQSSENRIGTFGGVGPARDLNLVTTAGGDFHVPGDYMYRTQEGFTFSGGLWGIFRVTPEVGGWQAAAPRTYCN